MKLLKTWMMPALVLAGIATAPQNASAQKTTAHDTAHDRAPKSEGKLEMKTRDGHDYCEIPRMIGEPRRAAAFGPVAAAPIFNSRPGATATLYLDFDGEVVTDPAWNGGNTINAAAFNLSTNEISQIVARTGEDYAPFNINVTTDPARYDAAPVGKRMRCIVTPTDTAGPRSGGVAYPNSFAQAGKIDQFSSTIPCWVFNSSVVGISEAASHELGHTLGLDHDGRTSPAEEYFEGHGIGTTISWAPIMGASYKANVTQWSKGEYQNANRFEDDVAIISGSANGFGYVTDEAGGTTATATALGFSGQTPSGQKTVAQSGVISTATDVDFFSFDTSGGAVTISANGAAILANLDIALEIRSSSGTVVASNNPPLDLNASISTSLAAGTYYVVLRGSGAGTTNGLTDGYTTYGSIGAYTLSGTIPTTPPTQRSFTWKGGDGNWNDTTKWTPTGFPQEAGDTANFPTGSGTVTIAQQYAIQAVNVSAGVTYQFAGAGGIGGFATLTTNGALTVSNPNTYNSTTTIGSGGSLRIGTGSTLGAIGSGEIINNGTLFLNRSNAIALANLISGAGRLNQSGSGVATLAGASTYSGGTTIQSGTLSVSANNNLGASASGVSLNGGTLQVTAGVTNTHVITVGTATGTVNVVNGQLILQTANTLVGSGALGVTGGNVRSDVAQSYSGTMTLRNGGSFEYRIAGASAGPFAVNALAGAAPGELIVNSGVTLSNPITVNGGILSFENGTAGIFSGDISLGALGVQVATRDWYGNQTAGRGGTISGLISGSGGLTKSNFAGQVALTRNNTYMGATLVQGGVLNANSTTGLPIPPASPITVNSGGTLRFQDHAGGVPNITNSMTLNGNGSGGLGALNLFNSANFSFTGAINLESDAVVKIDPQAQGPNSGALTWSGVISGDGGLTIWSAGTSTSNGVPVALSAANIYKGNTVVTSTNLNTTTPFNVNLNGAERLPSTTNLIFGGAPGANADVAVLLNGATQELASLSVASGATGSYKFLGNGAGAPSTLTINSANDSTFTGGLIGNLNLAKSGAGTFVPGGVNAYSGTTVINAGVLKLSRLVDGDPVSLGNAGFETPAIAAGGSGFVGQPADASWTFRGAGVNRNGGPFYSTVAPEGTQGGYIQGTGSISQSFTAPQAGTYRLNFQAIGRVNLGPNDLRASIDGTPVASVPTTLSTTTWTPFSDTATLTPGTHTLTFTGINSVGGDKSSAIDAVALTALNVAAGTLPTTTKVSLPSAATLDLVGTTQTIASLSGVASSNVLLGNLTLGDSATLQTFAGVLSGPGSISKVGPSTQLLNGNNSYAGATTVNGGLLRFSVGNFTETLGTLQFSGGAKANVSFGAGGAQSGTIKFANSSALDWSGALTVNGFRGTNYKLFFGAGQNLTAAQLAQISFLNPNNSVGTFAATQLASGEVVPIFAPADSSGALISEFRFHGAQGASDEFVEIFNTQNAPLNVGGWSIKTKTTSGIQSTSILEGTTIPARGHFLFTGSAYSLSSYGASNQTMPGDALDNSGVALFNAAGAVQDAVGFKSSDATLREGAGLPAAPTADGEYTFMRDYIGARPKDTPSDSSADFVFLAPTAGSFDATGTGITSLSSMLGAPSPEGLSSPSFANHLVTTLLLDPSASPNVAPNRVRTGSGASGTLIVRRQIVNNSGRTLSRIRFNVTRITSLGTPPILTGVTAENQADLRLVSGPNETGAQQVTLSDGVTKVDVFGTSLETPPAQDLGGGMGSSVNFDAVLATPLKPNEARNYSFVLNIKKPGYFSVWFNIQAPPAP